MRALRLLSGVTYPFLTRPDEFVPTSFERAQRQDRDRGLRLHQQLPRRHARALTSLFNTWARGTTSADKMAIAGSINVLVFTNVAESIVHSGAEINQDPFYRPDARTSTTDPDNYDPTADNDNVTHSTTRTTSTSTWCRSRPRTTCSS